MLDIPDYLYHYTSIETLAFILKYKTIRFNRLDFVDDPEESMTGDLGVFGRFCFVSCWTSMAEESIPMWHMYSKNMRGVRIKLPIFPFKEYIHRPHSQKWTKKDEVVEECNEYGKETYTSYIDLDYFFQKNCSTVPLKENILASVIYTTDEKLIFPHLLEKTERGVNIHINKLGIYKRKYWEFQQELRYKIFVSPFGPDDIVDATPEKINDIAQRYITNTLPFNDIFLFLDDNKFRDMEIRLGPKVSDAEKIIVDSLVKEYNSSARVTKSVLNIK